MSDRQDDFDPNGLATRREVIGDAYVDTALSQVDDFSWPMQELVTCNCWNDIWSGGPYRPPRCCELIALPEAGRSTSKRSVQRA
ncbi:MAG: hypothetical protein ABR580_02195 [Halomonas sp.]